MEFRGKTKDGLGLVCDNRHGGAFDYRSLMVVEGQNLGRG